MIRADVEKAAQGGAPAAQPAARRTAQAAPTQQAAPSGGPGSSVRPRPGPDQEVEEIPLSNIRRITGRRMVESLQSAPHFFLTALIDVTELLALRVQINEQLGEGERRVSVNDLIVKACALTLRAVPEVNVSFAGDKILKKKRIHVGIAVPTERGLIVPVISDTDQKSVGQIARESQALIEKARAGKLPPADYSGGTFTVSNLGMFGIEHFTAVINTPEAAILAVGAAMKEPAVVERRGGDPRPDAGDALGRPPRARRRGRRPLPPGAEAASGDAAQAAGAVATRSIRAASPGPARGADDPSTGKGRLDLLAEQAQRAHRLLVREVAPGEHAEHVVAAARLQQPGHLLAHAGRRAEEDRLVLGCRLPAERRRRGVWSSWSCQSLMIEWFQSAWAACATAAASRRSRRRTPDGRCPTFGAATCPLSRPGSSWWASQVCQ